MTNPQATVEIEALLPCPFCGGPARTFQYNGTTQAQCAKSYEECAGTDVTSPVAMWNRRATSPTPAAEGVVEAVSNPTGIEAAHAAYAKTVGGLLDGHPMENAIQAYLAATSPADVAGLVERLIRERDRHVIGYPGPRRDVAELLDTSIDTITSLSARAEAAEAALATAREKALEEAIAAAESCTISVPLTPGAADGASMAANQIIAAIRSLTGVSSNG